jgi:hypothetical protein
MEAHLVLATLAQHVTFELVWGQRVATDISRQRSAVSHQRSSLRICAAGSAAPTGAAAAQKLMADG